LALPSVFLLSGLIHDFGALPFDPHLDFSHITLFFFAQFVPLGIERAIRAVGGPRVGGWWGFVGTWGWMFVTGRWVVEGWLKKGLLGQVGEWASSLLSRSSGDPVKGGRGRFFSIRFARFRSGRFERDND
jgi:hypothetical protein